MNNIADDLAESYFNGIKEGHKMLAKRLKENLDISVYGYDTEEVKQQVFDTIDNLLQEIEKEGAE